VSQKCHHYIFDDNLNVNNCPITIIFGTLTTQSRPLIGGFTLSTSSIQYSCLTLGNCRSL